MCGRSRRAHRWRRRADVDVRIVDSWNNESSPPVDYTPPSREHRGRLRPRGRRSRASRRRSGAAGRELKRTLHPRAILPVKLGGQVVPEHTLREVQVFMLFYLLTFSVGTATVVAFGGDLMTGITATICLPRQHRPRIRDGRAHVELRVIAFFRLEAWRSARWSAT